jgi:hypothetical protein
MEAISIRRHTPEDLNDQHHCCVTSNLTLQCKCSLTTHLKFFSPCQNFLEVSLTTDYCRTAEGIDRRPDSGKECLSICRLGRDVGLSDQEGAASVLMGTGRKSDKAMTCGNAGARNSW